MSDADAELASEGIREMTPFEMNKRMKNRLTICLKKSFFMFFDKIKEDKYDI
jgi:hypothetical protein